MKREVALWQQAQQGLFSKHLKDWCTAVGIGRRMVFLPVEYLEDHTDGCKGRKNHQSRLLIMCHIHDARNDGAIKSRTLGTGEPIFVSKESEPANSGVNALPPPAFLVAAALQLFMWLFVTGFGDGGFVCRVYSCMVMAYWGIIGMVWLCSVRGRSLGRVVAMSSWIPPVACVFWLIWLSGFFRG